MADPSWRTFLLLSSSVELNDSAFVLEDFSTLRAASDASVTIGKALHANSLNVSFLGLSVSGLWWGVKEADCYVQPRNAWSAISVALPTGYFKAVPYNPLRALSFLFKVWNRHHEVILFIIQIRL